MLVWGSLQQLCLGWLAGVEVLWEPIREGIQSEGGKSDSSNSQLKVSRSHSTEGQWLKLLHQPSSNTNSLNTKREQRGGGKQRCPALWQISTSYPKPIYTWQLSCKWYLLISHEGNPNMLGEGQDMWEASPFRVSQKAADTQPCYQFRIALVKLDHMWLIVLCVER